MCLVGSRHKNITSLFAVDPGDIRTTGSLRDNSSTGSDRALEQGRLTSAQEEVAVWFMPRKNWTMLFAVKVVTAPLLLMKFTPARKLTT